MKDMKNTRLSIALISLLMTLTSLSVTGAFLSAPSLAAPESSGKPAPASSKRLHPLSLDALHPSELVHLGKHSFNKEEALSLFEKAKERAQRNGDRKTVQEAESAIKNVDQIQFERNKERYLTDLQGFAEHFRSKGDLQKYQEVQNRINKFKRGEKKNRWSD